MYAPERVAVDDGVAFPSADREAPAGWRPVSARDGGEVAQGLYAAVMVAALGNRSEGRECR